MQKKTASNSTIYHSRCDKDGFSFHHGDSDGFENVGGNPKALDGREASFNEQDKINSLATHSLSNNHHKENSMENI